ncbi:UvrD-helicase domain-containing protein [Pendulispora brunnea]|uniref:UvrD-helicase domain-containing protein n=1 Tax=Pendulispora brunnea TaxID=2905690 RepID=UPI00374E1FD6
MKGQWNAVYDAALELLDRRAIRAVVGATYARTFVDEYQDCTPRQHEIVEKLAGIVPTCVLGDPLQGIFGFAGGNLSWSDTVERAFEPLGTLDVPWRWRGKNDALGEWLLAIRPALLRGDRIDLSNAPIVWRLATPENQRREAFALLKSEGQIIAIRKWPSDAHAFARNVGGVFSSMEEMDCNDLLRFADDIDRLTGYARSARVLRFAAECWTEVGAGLDALQRALDDGRTPGLRSEKLRPISNAFAKAATTDDWGDIGHAMKSVDLIPDARLFRRELWREAIKAVAEVARGTRPSLRETAWQIRNRLRFSGRPVEPRSVSRTLLIKGLEFDHALVLDANEFENSKQPGDGARHFYVAVTRGARSLTVLSQQQGVRFSVPTV